MTMVKRMRIVVQTVIATKRIFPKQKNRKNKILNHLNLIVSQINCKSKFKTLIITLKILKK